MYIGNKEGNKEDHGNYRGSTLLNLIGKLYSRLLTIAC